MVMAVGIIASIMIGASIGIGSKNQMSATSVTVPVMMIFSFLPMLSMFNDKIAKVAKITYSEQIRILFSNLSNDGDYAKNIMTIIINIVLIGVLFSILYKKRGLA
jgi:ABC-2 type transport system permease protein